MRRRREEVLTLDVCCLLNNWFMVAQLNSTK